MALGKIKADTLEHSTAGSVDTQFVVTGSAKAWVFIDGSGTVAINDSLNTASLTDQGTGDYQVNFTNSMDNANYANTSNSNTFHAVNGNANSVNNLRVGTYNSSHSIVDTARVYSVAHGDLT